MIKRILTRMLYSASVLLIVINSVNGQVPVLDINFDGYNGTPATVPSGIYISWNSTSSLYTSTGNFGLSAPSYKFGNDSNYIVTKFMTPIDSITFWMKGNGTPLSPLNELRFYFSADSINYTLFAAIDSLPATAANYKITGNQVEGYIKMEYRKAPAGGNLAFDDLKIYSSVALGLHEAVSQNEVIIYPLPTTGLLNIRIGAAVEYPVVEVFDIIGNKIKTGPVQRKDTGLYTIDLSNCNKGFYFIKIISGSQLVTKRITVID